MLIRLCFLVILISGCSLSSSPVIRITETPAAVVIVVTATHTALPTSTPTNVVPTDAATYSVPTASIPPCSSRTDWTIYTVSPGDTLSGIAQRTGSTVNELASANCLRNANSISVGQQLRVPRPLVPVSPTTPLVVTPMPPTPFPELPVYFSDGNPPYDQCVVILGLNHTPQTTPLFFAADSNQPMNVNMGNWGLYMSSVNGFHQIVMYPSELPRNVFVRASDTSLVGAGCSGPKTTSITQGTIQIAPHMAAQSQSFDLRAGDVVTLTWINAPGGLIDVSFHLLQNDGTRTILASDAIESDGWSVQWSVPYNLTGYTIQAEGRGMNSAAFDFASALPVNVFSNSDPNWVCVAQNSAPLPIRERPDTTSSVIGELPTNTQWLVTAYSASANSNDDWIGIHSGGWVLTSSQVYLTGTCPF